MLEDMGALGGAMLEAVLKLPLGGLRAALQGILRDYLRWLGGVRARGQKHRGETALGCHSKCGGGHPRGVAVRCVVLEVSGCGAVTRLQAAGMEADSKGPHSPGAEAAGPAQGKLT